MHLQNLNWRSLMLLSHSKNLPTPHTPFLKIHLSNYHNSYSRMLSKMIYQIHISLKLQWGMEVQIRYTWLICKHLLQFICESSPFGEPSENAYYWDFHTPQMFHLETHILIWKHTSNLKPKLHYAGGCIIYKHVSSTLKTKNKYLPPSHTTPGNSCNNQCLK